MFHAEIGVRHVGGHLLVARRNQLDAVARLIERVEHADIAVATDAEDIRNVVGDQVLGNQLGALHPRHCGSLPVSAGHSAPTGGERLKVTLCPPRALLKT